MSKQEAAIQSAARRNMLKAAPPWSLPAHFQYPPLPVTPLNLAVLPLHTLKEGKR